MVGRLLPDLAGPRPGEAAVSNGGTLRSVGGPDLAEPRGRADLHVHTVASDGLDDIETILAHVMTNTNLDVLGIADHERIDGALAARAMARARGLRLEIIVGEEITTLEGHLLALFLEERVRPFRSMRTTIGEVHEQGGLAIPAHPLFPYPLCAQGWTLRRLVSAGDARVRPDALEAFNPTTFGRLVHARVGAFAAAHGLTTVGNSDAHEAAAIGTGFTTFPGRTADDVRTAIIAGATGWEGSFHRTASQLPTFGRQLRKYTRDMRAEVGGHVRRDGTGRDLGYPGGRFRPPRPESAGGVPNAREDAP
jgi:predicted metal-dependent phosphoesterase TrpH